ncbi:MAG: nucleoside hydrolase [Chloroflexota bacterium]|nr:nucleoside hydrolase [Chloroflexota bacterium]
MARKVILDVDTGIDDALAILLAANSPELEIVGVTCVAGNVTIDHVVRNTLAVLDLVGCQAPVAVGARKPLMAPLRTATLFHGGNGIAGIELPAPRREPVDEHAADFLTRLAREQPGEITLIPTGPLTNIALAVLRDATFALNAAGLTIMGGSVGHPGNVTPAAEANFSNDPEAAEAVATSGAPVQLVDLGATHSAILSMDRIEATRGRDLTPPARFARDLLEFYGAAYVAGGLPGPVLHDPMAVALVARPDLARFLPLWLRVETGGRYTRGESVGTFAGSEPVYQHVGEVLDVIGAEPLPHNATIARQINVETFLDLFMQRVGLE